MGWETANIHLGSLQARKAVLRDLKDRPDDWLHAATQQMSATITEDWEDWKRVPCWMIESRRQSATPDF